MSVAESARCFGLLQLIAISLLLLHFPPEAESYKTSRSSSYGSYYSSSRYTPSRSSYRPARASPSISYYNPIVYKPAPVIKTQPIKTVSVVKPSTVVVSRPLTSTYYPSVSTYISSPVYQPSYTSYSNYGVYTPPPQECIKTAAGKDYKGYRATTKSGSLCQRWSYAVPNNDVYTDAMFSEGSKYLAVNYCRNPDSLFTGGPWCYTSNPAVPWETCNIAACPGSTIPSPVGSTPSDPYGMCKVKSCPYGSRCEYVGKKSPSETRCVCPTQACPARISPLCASNGVTYDNECQYMKAACNSTSKITILHTGRCYEICKEDPYGVGYMGNVTVTRKGKTCQSWSTQSPNIHSFSSGNSFPEGVTSLVKNKCRNPDPASKKLGPWCYTIYGNDWDYCDVPSCAGCQKLDLVFALHESSRLSLSNWYDIVREVKGFVSALNIGPDNVRVGGLTYGDRSSVKFHLNKFNNKEDIVKAFDSILYSRQATNISGAVWTLKNSMFTPLNGDRPNVQNVVILIQHDTETIDSRYTSQYVRELQDSGTVVYSVGLGPYINSYSSSNLGSYALDNKSKRFSYYNYQFDKVHEVLNNVALDVCRNAPDNYQECTRKEGGWDYTGSVSKTKSGYNCRSWASEVPDEKHKYTDSMFPDGSRQAAGSSCRNPDRDFKGGPWCFTDSPIVPWEVCNIRKCTEKPGVVKLQISGTVDLGNVGLPYGAASTDDPCKTVSCPFGAKCERDLKGGPTATMCGCPTQECPAALKDPICGTDGNTYDNECVLMKAQCAARSAKTANTEKIAILHRGKCRCEKADVIFLFDSSGSISGTMWTRILQFSKDIVNTMNVGPNGFRIGALDFSDRAYISFHLNGATTKQDVLNQLGRVPKHNGATNTADAFYVARTQMFTAARGDRPDVPNIIILITDGESNINAYNTVNYAEQAKKAGITVISVGVQYYSAAYSSELTNVASEINGVRQVYHISNIYSMGNLHKTISTAVCTQTTDPCLDRQCLFGAKCKSAATSVNPDAVQCVCPGQICPYVYEPVCGSDKVSYDNECQLIKARCDKQKMIDVVNRGKCVDACTNYKCPFGADCVLGPASERTCVCKKYCPRKECYKGVNATRLQEIENKNKVCGSDGVTYIDECELKKTSCNNKTEITVKSLGPCPNLCASVNCTNYAECKVLNGKASCVCPSLICPTVYEPMCGSDGKNYTNECQMKTESCANQQTTTVKKRGACEPPVAPVVKVEFNNFCKTTTSGESFVGNMTKTITGKQCQAWSKQAPHKHPYVNSFMFKDGTVAKAGNQCRNPDPNSRSLGPWCYTTDPKVEWEYCDVPSCSECQLVDMVFILDSSASISAEFWPKALKFVKDLINNFAFGDSGARFGVVTFGYTSTIEFNLKDFSKKEDVLKRIDKIDYKGEATNTSGAIWTMREKMFTAQNGDRKDAPNICVLITDGGSNMDSENTIPYANDAKKSNITIFAVGVGSFIDQEELQGVASKVKGKEEVYYVNDYASLQHIRDEISGAICSGSTEMKSSSSKAPPANSNKQTIALI